MATPNSFITILRKTCREEKPKRILEWGPGISTLLMREECPDAEIITIEHQKKYYEECKHKFHGKDIKLYLKEAPEDDREDPAWINYCEPVIEGKFDLIFIDGRERVRCARFAGKVLANNGTIMLHDAERPQYGEIKEIFETIFDMEDTICLKSQS